MINKNELRLGNYVYDIVSLEWMIVDEIGKNVAATIIDRDKYPLADGWEMGAIPVSPEAMIRLGFKKHKSSNEYWNHWILANGWSISEWIGDGNPAGFEEKGILYYGEHFVPIRTVHGLQNIYFALTERELEILL